jgi:thiol-disulfide isomerase/thioredoxin
MKAYVSLLLAFAIFCAPAFAAAPTRTIQQLGPMKVGAPCPSFAGFTLDGDALSLARLLKPAKAEPATAVVISFFATYCKACKEKMPSIERVVDRLKDKGVRGVFIDYGEDADLAGQFAQTHNLRLPVVPDKFGKIAQRMGVDKTLPRTFVVDGKGTVATIFDLEGDDFEQALMAAVVQATRE